MIVIGEVILLRTMGWNLIRDVLLPKEDVYDVNRSAIERILFAKYLICICSASLYKVQMTSYQKHAFYMC